MKFNIKTYKLEKTKTYFLKRPFFFIYNTTAPKDIIQQLQKFKELEVTNYKIYNTFLKKTFRTSIYNKYQFLVRGLINLTRPKTNINIRTLKTGNNTNVLIGIKVNNKIYTKNQLNSSIKFSYVTDFNNLITTLKTVFIVYNNHYL